LVAVVDFNDPLGIADVFSLAPGFDRGLEATGLFPLPEEALPPEPVAVEGLPARVVRVP
jgi:hypothetical protein